MIMQHGKDSFWLQLEVCREYQRARCTRSDVECKFAHPPTNVEVGSNGRVTACYDSIKGRCQRETCKYMHPPAHLKDQLLINGRNHLALKNALLQQHHHLQQEPSTAAASSLIAGKTALASQLPATAATMAAAVAAVAAAATASSQQQQHSSSNSAGLSPLLQQHHHHLKQQPQQQQAALFQSAVAAAAASAAANSHQQRQQRHQTSAAAASQHLKQVPMQLDPTTLAALLAASSMNPFMVQGAPYSVGPTSVGGQYSAASQYAALAAAINQSNAAVAALQQQQQQQQPAGAPQPSCQPPSAPPLPPVTGSLLTGMLANGSPAPLCSSANPDGALSLATTRLGASSASPPAYCPHTTGGASASASPESSHSSTCEQTAIRTADAFYMTPANSMAALLGSQAASAVNTAPQPGPVNVEAPSTSGDGGEPSPPPLYQAPTFAPPTALIASPQASSTSTATTRNQQQRPMNRCKRPRSASPHTGYRSTSSPECHLASGIASNAAAASDFGKRLRLSSSSPPKDTQDERRRTSHQQSLTASGAEQRLPPASEEASQQLAREQLDSDGSTVVKQPLEERTTTSDAEQSTTLERSQPIEFRLNTEH